MKIVTSRVVKLRFEPLEDRQLLSAVAGSQTIELFGTSPALFVENQGQWADESIRFLHQGDGANVAMTDAGPVFQLFQREQTDQLEDSPEHWLTSSQWHPDELEETITETTQFSVGFDGANMVTPVGMDRTETYFSYFVGEQDTWRSGVAAYETVAYENLYDGIDLLTWGQRDSLKYEFHVAPGADYHQIQVSYDGIDGLWLDDVGQLHVQTPLGELIDEAPYIYQQLDGQQIEVPGDFTLIDAHTYAFTVTGSYDTTAELIIDPDLAWSTYLGGSETDGGSGIAVDVVGNVLVTGETWSPDWVSGGFDTSFNGSDYDVFVVKLSPTGDHLWSTYLGGSGRESALGIGVDATGNSLVTGWTKSSGWVSGGMDTSFSGSKDAFVVKLSPTGDHLWSTYLGGSESDSGGDIAVDAVGNALVTGTTNSSGWVSGGSDTTFDGYWDAFVVKLTATGDHLWSTYLGGSKTDYGSDIAVDTVGNVLVTGSTSSSGWVWGGFDTSFDGDSLVPDAFVTKLTTTGTHVWSTYLGGPESDNGYDIAVDSSGNVLVTGPTYSPGWVSGGSDTSHNGRIDAFVVKLSSSGSHIWSTYLGGGDEEISGGIAVDTAGNTLVTGRTYSPGWVSGGFDTSYNGGNYDAFVAKLSPTGGRLWSTYLGGSDLDAGYGIAVDTAGNALVTGYTYSPGWVSGGIDTSHNGASDAFVARITHVAVREDAYGVAEDQTLDVPSPGVLINDSDDLGHAVTAKPAEGPSHGTLMLRADGSFTYRPNENFHGTDSFTYRATDGDTDSRVATVTITVNPVNDPPQATDDTYTTDVNAGLAPLAPALLENDVDVEGDSLTANKMSDPAHALFFQFNDDGSFAYFPETDYQGPDSFTYKVTDGQLESNVATVTITVGTPRHPGDADLSGWTDLSDFNIWNANKFMQGTDWATGEFNGDGTTDLSDFNIWNAHKFTTALPPPVQDVVLQQADQELLLDELAWFDSLQQAGAKQDGRGSSASAESVDRLLATYWP